MLLVALVAGGGLALRLLILSSRLGDLNGDEAYAGLQSIGVVRDGRFAVVIDGSVYSAVIESYFFGPLLTFAGGSVTALKLSFVVVWGVASFAVAVAARQIAGKRASLIAGSLVWLAPGALLVLSTRAYMGYALGLAVVGVTVAATAVAADRAAADIRTSAMVGGGAGLAFYVHPMLLTVVVPLVAVAAVVHRHDWRRWWLPAASSAFAVNIPFLAWNAANGWPALGSQVYPPGTYAERFEGFFTGLLPRAFGLRSLDGEWVFGRPVSLVVYATLLATVIAGCVVLVKSSRRPSRLIVPVVLTSCLPLMALLPHLVYVLDGRYAILPFPFITIAIGAAISHSTSSWRPERAGMAAAAILVLWVAVTSLPFLREEDSFERADSNAWQLQVIDRLDELGIDRIAGAYWLVLPIEYRSDRAVRAAIAGNPYVIRFPESQRIVERTPDEQVAYVFGPGDQPPVWFRMPLDQYRTEEVAGVVLYIPVAATT